MRIERMTATFGKLENRTLELEPGLNVISAPNEWGKSTWCAFLLTMLYGVDTRAKTTRSALADKEHFAPWSGSPMSGRMEIVWKGRRITLERTTRGRIPMGQFRAFETQTGLTVPELTASNCGQQLLGVERSVFCRAGFLRLADLPVTQDEALRQRLNALVTTGDESGDAARLQKGLRELKNRCRYNQSGLLPQLQRERGQLLENLDALHAVQREQQGIARRLEENAAAQQALHNHQAALAYQAALRDRQRVEAAERVRSEAGRKLQAAQAACAGLPDAREAEKQQQTLHALREELSRLRQQSSPVPPTPPQTRECFSGKSEQEIRQQLTADIAACQNRTPLLLCLCAALLTVVVAGSALWLEKYVLAAVSAGLLVLSLLFLAVTITVGGKKRRALARRYGSPLPEDWQRAALRHLETQRRYRQQTEAFRQQTEALDRRRQQLRQRAASVCGGQEPEQCLRQWEQISEKWQALAAAQCSAVQAEEQYMALKEMARPLPPQPLPDDRRETAGQTADALEALYQQEQTLRGAEGACRGKMSALGQEEDIRKRLARTEQRIAALERYDAALTLAQSALAQATQELQRRFSPRITRLAQTYLSRLTLGKYDRIRLDEDLTLRSGSPEETALREPLWRSEGTVDQLYLALRLSVAQALTPDAPLVLDDALVRFDDARLAAALALLRELAGQRQILLFTCQHREEALLQG